MLSVFLVAVVDRINYLQHLDVLQVLYQFIRLQNSYNYIQFDGVVHSMTTIAKSEYIIQIMVNDFLFLFNF